MKLALIDFVYMLVVNQIQKNKNFLQLYVSFKLAKNTTANTHCKEFFIAEYIQKE